MSDKEIAKKILSIYGNFELSEVEQLNELETLYKNQEQEIERLNNIINELEEYMIGKDIYKILLYKLRDLKESDKVE